MKAAVLVVATMALWVPASYCADANTPSFKVNCVDPHMSCPESEQVIDTLKKLFEAFGRHDMKTVNEYVAEDCTGFGNSHKLLIGKEAILEHMETWLEAKQQSDSPLLSYTIERPYVQVTGDTAIVTFLAYKEIGGSRPRRYVSHSTDIFVKRDGKWMQTHYRNSWKEANATTASAETTTTPAKPGN